MLRSYFDWLPDEIVIDIIGRLNWNDAGKTSAVSHRFCKVFGYVCDQKLLNEKNLNFEDKTNVKFVDFVNHVLQAHKGSKVSSLKIALVGHYNIYSNELVEDDYETLPRNIITPGYVGYNRLLDEVNYRDKLKKRKIYAKAKDDFDGWMRFGKAKCIESLELSRYGLDAQVAPLYPAFPMLEAWDQLNALTLKSVHVADLYQGLQKSGHLKNLESLILEDALYGQLFKEDGSPMYTLLITSPTLKRLEIRQCRLKHISIHYTPNLEYFKYTPLPGTEPVDYHLNLVLSKLPKLSHIYLTNGYFTSFTMRGLQQEVAGVLEELELLVEPTTYTRRNFLGLQLVGHLKLNFRTINKRCNPLRVFKEMLATYPKLHKLTLVYHKWDKDMYGFSVESHGTHAQHYCLKEVKFVGWCGNKDEDDVVNFLKQIAPNLEKNLFE